jgi:DeoR/GlpR family transcriptional regulator of sugar metabolism
MLAIERRHKIMDRILRGRNVVVAELSEAFGVTAETVRRDLNRLEREGLVARTHGGAVAARSEVEDLPYGTRHLINIDAKRSIAAKAAALVGDNQSVMLDSSSTAFEVLAFLRERSNLTLITNSVRVLSDSDMTGHIIMSVGGELRRRSMTFVGPLATRAIEQFKADIALISCKALSLEGGMMESNVADAEVKRAFIRSARRVCLLADGDKFGETALIAIGGINDVDIVVTDRQPAEPWPQHLERAGTTLLV